MGLLELGAALVAILVQPTVGSISDYLTSRWGRRKPFIFVGGLLDLVFIIGIATSQSLLSLAAFLLLLSFSSNFAQGPFQGYVPDLVPERQVNVASALIGLMRLMGVIVGAALISTGATTGDYAVPLVLIGVIEAVLALITVATVREGPQGRPREGRSWTRIALETWGLDALRERSFVFMTLTRLLFLMGPAVFVNLSLFYVRDSLGQSGADLTDLADARDGGPCRRAPSVARSRPRGWRVASAASGSSGCRPSPPRSASCSSHAPRRRSRPSPASCCWASARAATWRSTGR